MADVTLHPISRPFDAQITPPGSKSLTNRALVLAALADGDSELSNILFADDTLAMLDGLSRLGFGLEVDRGRNAVRIHGQSGRVPAESAELFCANSGTTIRFLTALCALGRGVYRLDGVARMRQRPIGQLVDLLRNYAVRVEYLDRESFPPIEVRADGLAGGIARFPAAQSSQFLSAVLQVCPYTRHEACIDLDSPQTSWPYVAMTMQLMDQFGVTADLRRDPHTGEPIQTIVPRGIYRPTAYAVEPDASSASYFLAAAAISRGSKITVHGLGRRSLQGDVGLADLLHRMGADVVFGPDFVTVTGSDRLMGIDADMSDMPDVAQTLAVVAVFADSPTTLRGLHTLRVKETDRIAALAAELRTLGAGVEIAGDALTIRPPRAPSGAVIDTYDDHRMAMSFAVAGLRVPGMTIRDAQCVSKSYPRFFEDFARLAQNVRS